MAISNECYVRKGLQDPNDPFKCLDVDQPAKVISSDQFGNQWYDFNEDFIKNGAICDPFATPKPTCEVRPLQDFDRRNIYNTTDKWKWDGSQWITDGTLVWDLTVYKATDIDCNPINPSTRAYIRRGLQDPDTGKTSTITKDADCKTVITFARGGSDVPISDFAIITENRLIIVAEQDGDIYFEPAGSTTTDNFTIL